MQVPRVGAWGGVELPAPPPLVVGSRDGVATVFLSWFFDPRPACSGASVTVQKTDGSLRRVVPFTLSDGVGSPPMAFLIAVVPIPRANGVGDWVVTSVNHAGRRSRSR